VERQCNRMANLEVGHMPASATILRQVQALSSDACSVDFLLKMENSHVAGQSTANNALSMQARRLNLVRLHVGSAKGAKLLKALCVGR